MIVFIVSIFVALIYVWWASRVAYGFKDFSNTTFAHSEAHAISIVVPFRNEAANLPRLVNSIAALEYPLDKFEVILIDDQSTDDFLSVMNELKQSVSFKMSLLHATTEGKKAAQFLGVSHAKYQIIACTDADCTIPPTWLKSINASFSKQKRRLVFGPVLLNKTSRPLQELEFLSLIGSTVGMLALQWPVMGNGANMAFKKNDFLKVYPSLESRTSPSGDDVFLLHELSELEEAVGLIYGQSSCVYTNPQESVKTLLSQRIRWASKGKLYTSAEAVMVALLVFGINALLLFLLGSIITFSKLAIFNFVLLLLVKCVADYFLLSAFANYFNQPFKLFHFLLQEMINIVYVPVVGVLSQISSYSWKGRKY